MRKKSERKKLELIVKVCCRLDVRLQYSVISFVQTDSNIMSPCLTMSDHFGKHRYVYITP